MKLFCFPYAGGISTLTYSSWKSQFNDDIEVIPIEMPGREKAIKAGSFDSILQAVDSLVDSLDQTLSGDYAFWGHSMGAIVAYELTRKLHEKGQVGPKHLFLSGKKPFHLPRDMAPIHTYDDKAFIEQIYALNGTKKGRLDNTEIRDLFMPILRKDFEVVYHYKHENMDKKVKTPTTIMIGDSEDISDNENDKWKEIVSGDYKVYTLPGDHFFIHDNVTKIAEIIKSRVQWRL